MVSCHWLAKYMHMYAFAVHQLYQCTYMHNICHALFIDRSSFVHAWIHMHVHLTHTPIRVCTYACIQSWTRRPESTAVNVWLAMFLCMAMVRMDMDVYQAMG